MNQKEVQYTSALLFWIWSYGLVSFFLNDFQWPMLAKQVKDTCIMWIQPQQWIQGCYSSKGSDLINYLAHLKVTSFNKDWGGAKNEQAQYH